MGGSVRIDSQGEMTTVSGVNDPELLRDRKELWFVNVYDKGDMEPID